MTLKTPVMTPEQFDAWVYLPENIDTDYELIAGLPVEITAIPHHISCLTSHIAALIGSYVYEYHTGRITGARGVYCVGPDRYGPGVGYISRARQPIAFDGAHNPLAPDLAVEVLSPIDTPQQIRIKIVNYIAAGTVVWIVCPDDQMIEIYIPDQPGQVLGIDDTLDGGTVLPGFSLPVKTAFAD